MRRAGQLDRFLRLVAIEYGRGVSDGRVTKDFEIQEAITFRDGAAAAFADLEPLLLARDARRHAPGQGGAREPRLEPRDREPRRARRSRRTRSTRPSTAAFDDLDALYPAEWKEAAEAADFDVIAAALDRMQAAAASR